MELDNLKQSWNRQSQQNLKPSANDFMELIHNKSYGPIANLKNKFKLQLLAFPAFVAVIIYDFIKKPALLNDVTMWFFIAAVIALTGYFRFNYTIINRLGKADKPVKETIEKDIAILENGFKKYFIAARIVLALFFILSEVLMHFHKLPDFESWYAYSLPIRIAAYTALFIFHYFLGKYTFQKQYGQHLALLKDLLKKTD